MPEKKMNNLLYCYNPRKMLQVLDVLILLDDTAIAVPVFDQ